MVARLRERAGNEFPEHLGVRVMALSDPVAVYNAANNLEAQLVRDVLIDSGVEAFVTEDVSLVGVWFGGLIPELHKPQVWIERANIEPAKPILDEYERRSVERRNAGTEVGTAETTLGVVCEECVTRTCFPASQRGSVQNCPNCGAYIDVGDDESSEYWLEGQTEDQAEHQ